MLSNLIDINPDIDELEVLNLYIDFINKRNQEFFPKDPITSHTVQLDMLKEITPGIIHIRKALYNDDLTEIIARIYIKIFTEEHAEYKKNKHIAELDVNILKNYRNLKLAELLFRKAIEIIKEYNQISVIEGCTKSKDEWEVWKLFGAKETYSANVNRVYLDEIDWDLMGSWREEGKRIQEEKNISIKSFEKCPEVIIDEYTSFYNEVLNLVPWGELEWKPPAETPEYRRIKEERQTKMGKKWYTMITVERSGHISGLTEILHNPEDDYWVHQLLTGVKKEYRGRGLGKLLKVEMLYFIKEKLPEVILIHTGNAEINAPMLSINERMGFKRYSTDKCFTINLE